MMDETHVYLIAHVAPDGRYVAPVKIGFSMSPEKRLRSLQTGNPAKLGIVFSFLTPSAALAKQAESVFHEVCKEERLAGEWFSAPPKRALATLTKVLLGCIGMDLGSDDEGLTEVLQWSGLGRAVELFSTLPDEVSE